MSAAHTPGPLVFEPHGAFRSKLGDGDWPIGYISRGHDKPIFELKDATCWFGKPMPAKQLAAYARLIAAAPALLDLLCDALEIIDDQLPGEFPAFSTDARAAISLAKGESA